MGTQVQVLTLTLAAASANNISASQTPTFPANFLINGSAATNGVATLDVARRVIITTTDNTHTATVTGTDRNSNIFSETITLNGGAAASNHDFLTITKVSTNAQITAAATIGTNTTGSSAPILLDQFPTPGMIAVHPVLVSGSATFSIECAVDDFGPTWDLNNNQPNWFTNPVGLIATAAATPAAAVFSGLTATNNGVINQPLSLIRLTITTGTGVVSLTVLQALGRAKF